MSGRQLGTALSRDSTAWLTTDSGIQSIRQSVAHKSPSSLRRQTIGGTQQKISLTQMRGNTT
ncbi:hypothetical protein KIN20_011091 [Parelaphostrongylus tenuis]|uniref:Uncharacterized protein n=1 Tax=Parelaphostrongylus tenuis TaxID=148309 RepID=A0AAD5MRK6_PARTN|nr:hypothetical protein KIN20_011091 [Parelaphostrongylus tenuis]